MSDPLRFFLPPESLLGDQVTIRGDAHHHLHNVLRTRLGSVLTLLDGQGQCCEVELQAINKREALGRVLRRWREQEEALPLTLIQAVPKGDKFDLVLQKGTELGVRCFQLVKTAHAVPQTDAARMTKREQRWLRIVTEAARQCRRSYLPHVNFHGEDSFSYEACDPVYCDQATVTISVNPVNDAPLASDDSVVTPENRLVVYDVLANVSDSDGDPLAIDFRKMCDLAKTKGRAASVRNEVVGVEPYHAIGGLGPDIEGCV